jgi:archaellum component FlaC
MNEIEQLTKRVELLESKVGKFSDDITGIQKDIGYLAKGFDKMEQSVKESIKVFTDSLDKLKAKDGEMWRTTVKQIITAIIAALATAIAMYLKK